MPSLFPPTIERTLSYCRSRSWACRTTYVSSLSTRKATFSSSPPTVTVNSRVSPHPSVLERNKLQEYLDFVASSNEVTVQDVERHKPAKYAPPGTSRYESDYEGLVRTLCQSFTVKQLKDVHGLFGLELPKKQTKREFAISIIERQWEWPSLSDSLKQRKDRTEVVSRAFPLKTREAFLLLGKDGTNLHMLSCEHNVRTSFKTNPLSLAVKGVRGSVERVARYIDTFKSDVAEDIFRLPTEQEVSPKLNQRVSRLSGALVESRDKYTLQVTYHTREPRTKHIAKALTLRAAYESLEQPLLLACVAGDDDLMKSTMAPASEFSLYPFIPARPLPWTVTNGGVFRVRDVATWFEYNEKKHIPLLSSDHLTIGTDGQVEDLRKRLLDNFTNNIVSEKTSSSIQVSLGHSLLYEPSIPSDVLIPPVIGNTPLPELMQKLKKLNKRQIFIPSISRRIFELESHRQRLIHRLIYRAVPKTKCAKDLARIDFIRLEFSHDTMEVGNTETSELGDEGDGALSISAYGCWKGSQSMVDLLLPERMMDLRFSIENASETPEFQWPEELREYKETLNELSTSSLDASRANAPQILSDNDITYVLESSALIRQSIDELPTIDENEDVPQISSENEDAPQIISENVQDLNSNQRYGTCKMMCENPSSEESWKLLMLACDHLTAYPTPKTFT